LDHLLVFARVIGAVEVEVGIADLLEQQPLVGKLGFAQASLRTGEGVFGLVQLLGEHLILRAQLRIKLLAAQVVVAGGESQGIAADLAWVTAQDRFCHRLLLRRAAL
jgi:hypothetical protein